MARESTLTRIAALHAFLVALLVLAFTSAGWPVRGALLGGGAMGLSFLALWGIAKLALARPRGPMLPLLVTAKVLFYLGLVAAALTGRIVADGEGFAAGIGCFLAATLLVTASGAGMDRRRA